MKGVRTAEASMEIGYQEWHSTSGLVGFGVQRYKVGQGRADRAERDKNTHTYSVLTEASLRERNPTESKELKIRPD